MIRAFCGIFVEDSSGSCQSVSDRPSSGCIRFHAGFVGLQRGHVRPGCPEHSGAVFNKVFGV